MASTQEHIEVLKTRIKQATDDGRFDEIPLFLRQIHALTCAGSPSPDCETPRKQQGHLHRQGTRSSTGASTRATASGRPSPFSTVSVYSTPLPPGSPTIPRGGLFDRLPASRQRPHTARACLLTPAGAPTPSDRSLDEEEPLSTTQAPRVSQSLPKRPGTAPGRPSATSARPPSAPSAPSGRRPALAAPAAAAAPAPTQQTPLATLAASCAEQRPTTATSPGGVYSAASPARARGGRPTSSTCSSTPSPAAAAAAAGSSPGWPATNPALASRPYGHVESVERSGQLERVLPPGEVHPRHAKIFSQTDFMGSSVWRPEEWLQMRQQALSAGRTDQLVPLLQAVRASTEKAARDRAYEVAGAAVAPGRGQRVDMRSIMPINPDLAWCRRDSLSSVAPPPSLGKRTPRMQVGSESPLDVAICLKEAGATAPVFLAVEAYGFTSEGLIDARSAQAFAPEDLLLRTDFGRFLGQLHDSCCSQRGALHRKLARDKASPSRAPLRGAPARGEQAPLREELTALDDPSVIVCRQVTIFRGPLDEGYPFLREPVRITVLLTAMPSQDPRVASLQIPGAGRAEWYNDHREQEAVVARLDLIAELARQEANRDYAVDPSSVDPRSAPQPPVLLLCPPGSGAPRQQPHHAVAYTLRAWRFRFGACFGRVHLCCREPRREQATGAKLAQHWSSVINEDGADQEAPDRIAEAPSLPQAMQEVRHSLLPAGGDRNAGVENVRAMLQRKAKKRLQARLAQEAESMKDPAVALRSLSLAAALIPATRAGGARRESCQDEPISPHSLKESSLASWGDSQSLAWSNDFRSEGTDPRRHSSCSSLRGGHGDVGERPAAKRRKSCEVDCRGAGRSYSDWGGEQAVSKVASMRTLAARQALVRKARVFAQRRQRTDRQRRKELDQVRNVSSMQVALGEHAGEDVVLPACPAGALRPGIRENGTKRYDPEGVYGATDVKDFKPHVWGHGADKRRVSFETGRPGEYERLRDWHRRRMAQPRAKAAAIEPHAQQPMAPAADEGGEEESRSTASKATTPLDDDSPAVPELVLRSPAGQISRQMMRQRASVFVAASKLEDAADDHNHADRGATQVEGALLVMAREVGDRLQTARDRREASASKR